MTERAAPESAIGEWGSALPMDTPGQDPMYRLSADETSTFASLVRNSEEIKLRMRERLASCKSQSAAQFDGLFVPEALPARRAS